MIKYWGVSKELCFILFVTVVFGVRSGERLDRVVGKRVRSSG